MQTLNELYRSLAKKYHPDTVSSDKDKALFEELMVEINIARERGDLDTLKGIEKLGPVYLAVRNYERMHRAKREAHVERRTQPTQAPVTSSARPSRLSVASVLQILHPYALWGLMESWNDHGAVRKLSTITISLGWNFLFYSGWGLLDDASRFFAQHGSGHESVLGLFIVLLRGALILAALPCVLPSLILAFLIGLVVAALWLCSTIASAVLGCFHPLLALLPPWIMGGLLLLTGWSALQKQ